MVLNLSAMAYAMVCATGDTMYAKHLQILNIKESFWPEKLSALNFFCQDDDDAGSDAEVKPRHNKSKKFISDDEDDEEGGGLADLNDDYDSEEDEDYNERPRKKHLAKSSGFILDEAGKVWFLWQWLWIHYDW